MGNQQAGGGAAQTSADVIGVPFHDETKGGILSGNISFKSTQKFSSKYTVHEKLGQGGFAIVYRVSCPATSSSGRDSVFDGLFNDEKSKNKRSSIPSRTSVNTTPNRTTGRGSDDLRNTNDSNDASDLRKTNDSMDSEKNDEVNGGIREENTDFDSDRKIYAVKTLNKNKIKRMGMKKAEVLKEISIMSSCTHKNILKVFEAFENEQEFHFIMEYCPYGDLQNYVLKRCNVGNNSGVRIGVRDDGESRRDSRQGSKQSGCYSHGRSTSSSPSNLNYLTEREASKFLKQILEAIAYLHSVDIVHRDIKPHNFMIWSDKETLKLGDFGVAIIHKLTDKLLTERIGTPAFMSPEVHLLVRGADNIISDPNYGYDRKIDVWSAGVMLVFLLSSECPYVDGNNRLLRDELIQGQVPLWEIDTSFLGLFKSSIQSIGNQLGNQLGFEGLVVGNTTSESVRQPSQLAKKMVRTMLVPDPRYRPSATRVLDHPWLYVAPTGACDHDASSVTNNIPSYNDVNTPERNNGRITNGRNSHNSYYTSPQMAEISPVSGGVSTMLSSSNAARQHLLKSPSSSLFPLPSSNIPEVHKNRVVAHNIMPSTGSLTENVADNTNDMKVKGSKRGCESRSPRNGSPQGDPPMGQKNNIIIPQGNPSFQKFQDANCGSNRLFQGNISAGGLGGLNEKDGSSSSPGDRTEEPLLNMSDFDDFFSGASRRFENAFGFIQSNLKKAAGEVMESIENIDMEGPNVIIPPKNKVLDREKMQHCGICYQPLTGGSPGETQMVLSSQMNGQMNSQMSSQMNVTTSQMNITNQVTRSPAETISNKISTGKRNAGGSKGSKDSSHSSTTVGEKSTSSESSSNRKNQNQPVSNQQVRAPSPTDPIFSLDFICPQCHYVCCKHCFFKMGQHTSLHKRCCPYCKYNGGEILVAQELFLKIDQVNCVGKTVVHHCQNTDLNPMSMLHGKTNAVFNLSHEDRTQCSSCQGTVGNWDFSCPDCFRIVCEGCALGVVKVDHVDVVGENSSSSSGGIRNSNDSAPSSSVCTGVVSDVDSSRGGNRRSSWNQMKDWSWDGNVQHHHSSTQKQKLYVKLKECPNSACGSKQNFVDALEKYKSYKKNYMDVKGKFDNIFYQLKDEFDQVDWKEAGSSFVKETKEDFSMFGGWMKKKFTGFLGVGEQSPVVAGRNTQQVFNNERVDYLNGTTQNMGSINATTQPKQVSISNPLQTRFNMNDVGHSTIENPLQTRLNMNTDSSTHMNHRASTLKQYVQARTSVGDVDTSMNVDATADLGTSKTSVASSNGSALVGMPVKKPINLNARKVSYQIDPDLMTIEDIEALDTTIHNINDAVEEMQAIHSVKNFTNNTTTKGDITNAQLVNLKGTNTHLLNALSMNHRIHDEKASMGEKNSNQNITKDGDSREVDIDTIRESSHEIDIDNACE